MSYPYPMPTPPGLDERDVQTILEAITRARARGREVVAIEVHGHDWHRVTMRGREVWECSGCYDVRPIRTACKPDTLLVDAPQWRVAGYPLKGNASLPARTLRLDLRPASVVELAAGWGQDIAGVELAGTLEGDRAQLARRVDALGRTIKVVIKADARRLVAALERAQRNLERRRRRD